ncbi:MAG TPA: valine--tRNA ligase [Sandaracinaceae bacterium LLY-WYZ-13_1]|nr:valine--tRNA ligase [Sandaracinaceae bacterium LLY-WYZ-13_1]
MSQDDETFSTIDFAALPKHFDSKAAEEKWDAAWQERGIYHYDPSRPREETFVVDTPPPTVSGALHVGHLFSYTHTDVLVRQRRMRGQNIFYPMGWDDNGLPTERRVQNYFHVRCEPHVPYEPDLALEPASAKKRKKERPRVVSRRNFIELCQQVTQEDEQAFMALWRRLGLSVDWRQEYATIDERSRHLAQLSFLDLFDKGHLYSNEAPTMWDVDFQTAVAQAEVEDRPKKGAFHDIRFGVKGSERSFVISTTRPELLPACVGVTAHPDDERYQDLFGQQAITPLFHAPVPIFPSELADKEKGTGILMVCTFGDQTDVTWWREQNLALRQVIGRDGRLVPVTFGEGVWESEKPELANRCYAELAGKRVGGARQAIVELLRDPEGRAAGDDAPLQGEPEPTDQAVKHYEKGDRPLEFITTRQWFVRLMDQKDALLERGAQIQWHPGFMHQRYQIWTENLGLDWCISRQRYFGVPLPVWYPTDADGVPDYERPIVAASGALPVDPMSDPPPGFEEGQRDQPNGFTGDPDVFDTWFTSSLTPEIGSHWWLDEARHARLFPADIRPQSHEIIRTWAFYTIAKAHLHEDTIPWKHVVISGWVVDPQRKKISKSKGNVKGSPPELLDSYSADGVRYWAAGARLGTDTAFDEKVFKIGKRLVTKLYNAGKFVLSQQAPRAPISNELDRAFVAKLAELTREASAAFDEFEFAKAMMATEQFFWASFTDTFLELTKARARGDFGGPADQGSAVAALRLGLNVLLRLFAPVLPYITEEVWSWVFAEETGQPSIHAAPWPTEADFADVTAPDDPGSFELAVEALATINKAKSDAGVSVGRVTEHLVLGANAATKDRLAPVWEDVAGAARCQDEHLEANDGLEDGAFEVREARFAEKPEKK